MIDAIVRMIEVVARVAVLLGTAVIVLSVIYWIYAVRRIHALEAKLWLRQMKMEVER